MVLLHQQITHLRAVFGTADLLAVVGVKSLVLQVVEKHLMSPHTSTAPNAICEDSPMHHAANPVRTMTSIVAPVSP